MEIKNLRKVASRIFEAVKNQEKIIIYGDTDLDGVASVIVLKETLEFLGYNRPIIYFPNREKEGYGINRKALLYLKKYAKEGKTNRTLFIAVDCGIGNFEEVKEAERLGFEVIIIDHHEILKKLPKASIIVDPKQKSDRYPFKELAAAGIIFKLAEILLGDKLSPRLRKNLIGITALATIADMMPIINDNKELIEEGLRSIDNSERPGLKVFFKMDLSRSAEERKNQNNLQYRISKINSLLNVRDVKKGIPASFRLLTNPSESASRKIVKQLLRKNLKRKQKISAIIKVVEKRILKQKKLFFVFEGEKKWDLVSLSPVASIICQKYKKPSFIFKKGREETQGTIRMPSGINSIKALMRCSKFLKTYGGHPAAAGFRIKNKNLKKFKNCLKSYFEKQ